MKLLEPLRWDRDQCRRELEEFRLFLTGAGTRNEGEDILPFFKEHKHLSALIGSYSGTITQYDLLKHEYPLFGDYMCDLVIGDSARQEYGFVEFEIAAPKNIFVKKPKKVTPQWALRFEQGYSQLVDWFSKLNEMEHTPD